GASVKKGTLPMLRNVLMLFPALAFAVPFIASQPSSARPLATPGEEATFCWGDCPGVGQTGPDKPGGIGEDADIGISMALEFCMAVQVLVEDRACEIRTGDACFAACDEIAIEPYCAASVGDIGVCLDDTV